MNFSRNSRGFFKSMKNIMNSKYSGNVINCTLNKMRVKSYLNFSNNFFAFKIATLNNQILSNISELKQITSGQDKLNSEATIDSSNLNNLLIAEYTRMLYLIASGSKIFYF